MMLLPYVGDVASTRDMITKFGGYNNSETCAESEAYDEACMTSDRSLVLRTREPRLTLRDNVYNVKGMHVNNGLLEIRRDSDGYENVLFFNDTRIAQLPSADDRMMCSMGAYVIIFPDKKRFNTLTNELESLEDSFTTSGSVTFTPCTIEGTTINPTVSNTMPSNPTNGAYWLDTSKVPHTLKVWSQSEGMWNAVATSYVKISATGIGQKFKKLDVVKISGVTTYPETFNVDMAIWDRTDNSIIVTAVIDSSFTNTGITLAKEVPDMDFICEHGNRLWGCSSEKHEIYASKLGDPTNFKSFIGTVADSYAVTVGSDGDFTGCAEHGGTVVFFKEKYIHKIYGTTPSNYQVDTKPEKGVQKGSYKSLTLISGVLYYKAVDGVMRYEGSYPVLISQNLGNTMYKNAEGATWKNKLYMCMQEMNDATKLFTFDTQTGLWHIEDEWYTAGKRWKHFINYKNRLIFWDTDETKLLIEGSDRHFGDEVLAESEEIVAYRWQSGIIGLDLPSTKYVSQIVMRFEMAAGAELSVFAEYDSSGSLEDKIAYIKNEYNVSRRDTPGYTKLRSVEIPFTPKRCDHMRLHITGNGQMKIYSISKKIEGGGL